MTIAIVSLFCKIVLILNEVSARIRVSWTCPCQHSTWWRWWWWKLQEWHRVTRVVTVHLNNCKSVPGTEFFQLRDDEASLNQSQFGFPRPHTVGLQCVFRHIICKQGSLVILQVLKLSDFSSCTLCIHRKSSFNFGKFTQIDNMMWEIRKNTWDTLTEFSKTPVSV